MADFPFASAFGVFAAVSGTYVLFLRITRGKLRSRFALFHDAGKCSYHGAWFSLLVANLSWLAFFDFPDHAGVAKLFYLLAWGGLLVSASAFFIGGVIWEVLFCKRLLGKR